MGRLRARILLLVCLTPLAAAWLTYAAYQRPAAPETDRSMAGWWRYLRSPHLDWDPAGFLALLAAVALPLFLATSLERTNARAEEASRAARTIGLELVTLTSCFAASVLAWGCLPGATASAGLPLLNGVGAAGLALLFATLAALAAPSDALVHHTRTRRAQDLEALRDATFRLRDAQSSKGTCVDEVRADTRLPWVSLTSGAILGAILFGAAAWITVVIHLGRSPRWQGLSIAATWQIIVALILLSQYVDRQVLMWMGRRFAGLPFILISSLLGLLLSVSALAAKQRFGWFGSGLFFGMTVVAPWVIARTLRGTRSVVLLVVAAAERKIRLIDGSTDPDHPFDGFA